jgi:hypothetical protein
MMAGAATAPHTHCCHTDELTVRRTAQWAAHPVALCAGLAVCCMVHHQPTRYHQYCRYTQRTGSCGIREAVGAVHPVMHPLATLTHGIMAPGLRLEWLRAPPRPRDAPAQHDGAHQLRAMPVIPKPLLVLLPWVWAEPQHVHKYTQLAHEVRPAWVLAGARDARGASCARVTQLKQPRADVAARWPRQRGGLCLRTWALVWDAGHHRQRGQRTHCGHNCARAECAGALTRPPAVQLLPPTLCPHTQPHSHTHAHTHTHTHTLTHCAGGLGRAAGALARARAVVPALVARARERAADGARAAAGGWRGAAARVLVLLGRRKGAGDPHAVALWRRRA